MISSYHLDRDSWLKWPESFSNDCRTALCSVDPRACFPMKCKIDEIVRESQRGCILRCFCKEVVRSTLLHSSLTAGPKGNFKLSAMLQVNIFSPQNFTEYTSNTLALQEKGQGERVLKNSTLGYCFLGRTASREFFACLLHWLCFCFTYWAKKGIQSKATDISPLTVSNMRSSYHWDPDWGSKRWTSFSNNCWNAASMSRSSKIECIIQKSLPGYVSGGSYYEVVRSTLIRSFRTAGSKGEFHASTMQIKNQSSRHHR